MKRILGIHMALCLGGLSVFFTGCNQKAVSSYVEVPVYDETGVRESTEAETEPLKKGGPKEVDEIVRSQTDQFTAERFKNLTGHRAFAFPANHSQAASDMTVFKILGLEEGYFYYYYVTRDTVTQEEVHAVARNKEDGSGDFKLLYQRTQEREAGNAAGVVWPFYVHMCANVDGNYRISIYEDGQLSVIDKDGNVKFSRVSQDIRFGSVTQSGGENLLELIDQIFGVGGKKPYYYDRDITSVTMDGRYNFYIPVTLTVNDYTKLEEEDELVTETYLLCYSYMPIGADGAELLIQYNENYDNQCKYWEELGDDKETRGSAQSDWNKALKEYPDKWGGYYVAQGKDYPVTNVSELYKWTNPKLKNFVEGKKKEAQDGTGQSFAKADGTFIEMVTELKSGQPLNGYFFQDEKGGYCPVIGAVKDKARTIVKQRVSRTYDVESESQDPKEVMEYIDANVAAKEYFADGSAIERFYVLDNRLGLYVTPGKVVDGSYITGMCMPNVCVVYKYAKQSDMIQVLRTIGFLDAGEDMGIYILNTLKDQPYVLGADLERDRLLINSPDNKWITLMAADLNPLGYQKTSRDKELTDELEKQWENSGNYSLSSVDLYGNPDRFGADNVQILEDVSTTKILITTFYNGMQLYEGYKEAKTSLAQSSPGTMYRISDYPLYQAWLTEDGEVTAVGFDRTDMNYQYMDIAMARVYTFNINEQMENAQSRKIPSDDSQEDEASTLPAVPEIPVGMRDYWDKAEGNRETKSPTPDSETVPDVFIYETGAAMGDTWKEAEKRRQARLESESESEDKNDGDE